MEFWGRITGDLAKHMQALSKHGLGQQGIGAEEERCDPIYLEVHCMQLYAVT